jgi:hypothetical protein
MTSALIHFELGLSNLYHQLEKADLLLYEEMKLQNIPVQFIEETLCPFCMN